MNRILIVGVNWLGDSLLTTPVFKAIKRKFPAAFLGVMTVDRVRGVFDDNPYIDEVIVFNEKGQHKGFLAKLRFINYLRKKKLDTVFLIHRSFTRAFICFLAGIKLRIGYQRFKNSFVINKKIKLPQPSLHRQDYYLYLFEQAVITIADRQPQFFISDAVRKEVADRLCSIQKGCSYLIGINPSANWELKRWPASYFASLADFLAEGLKAAIVFTGADKEKPVIEEVRQRMKQDSFSFCGKTSLKELAAIISNMDIFISNDSGPAHLAAALDVKTLVIFGPTSPEATSPRGKSVKVIKAEVDCEIPCYKLDCRDNICLKNLSVDEVYSKVKNILVGDGCAHPVNENK